jgi:hypothetical protein
MEFNVDDTQRSTAEHHTPRRSGCRRRTAESDGDVDSRAEDQHRCEGRSRNTPRKAQACSVPGGQVDGHSFFVVQRRAGDTSDARAQTYSFRCAATHQLRSAPPSLPFYLAFHNPATERARVGTRPYKDGDDTRSVPGLTTQSSRVRKASSAFGQGERR